MKPISIRSHKHKTFISVANTRRFFTHAHSAPQILTLWLPKGTSVKSRCHSQGCPRSANNCCRDLGPSGDSTKRIRLPLFRLAAWGEYSYSSLQLPDTLPLLPSLPIPSLPSSCVGPSNPISSGVTAPYFRSRIVVSISQSLLY